MSGFVGLHDGGCNAHEFVAVLDEECCRSTFSACLDHLINHGNVVVHLGQPKIQGRSALAADCVPAFNLRSTQFGCVIFRAAINFVTCASCAVLGTAAVRRQRHATSMPLKACLGCRDTFQWAGGSSRS